MIAIDWGTSSFRAYRLSGDGGILEKREAAKGILAVAPGQFAAVLEQQLAGWDEPLVAMSGMVGSRQGWTEVPYVDCPAGLDEIAAGLKEVQWGRRRAWIVPGLACRDESGVPDVMRGEETQILGAMHELPRECAVCLPGTHSKWASVRDGIILRFRTYFTGEAYAVLQKHSLLGRMMTEGAAPDDAAFRQGLERSGEAGGLLHHLFGVRTRGLFGELAPEASPSYLSGILIGHELRDAGRSGAKIYLLGTPALTQAYERAADTLDIEVQQLPPESATRGLFELGKRIGT